MDAGIVTQDDLRRICGIRPRSNWVSRNEVDKVSDKECQLEVCTFQMQISIQVLQLHPIIGKLVQFTAEVSHVSIYLQLRLGS